MNLPNNDLLLVEREKVTEYLLNSAHRYGASKACFFGKFGFRAEEPEVLSSALREHGRRHNVAREKDTDFGLRYEVDGELVTPNGRRPQVRTVWQMDKGQLAPRLITAHPLE